MALLHFQMLGIQPASDCFIEVAFSFSHFHRNYAFVIRIGFHFWLYDQFSHPIRVACSASHSQCSLLYFRIKALGSLQIDSFLLSKWHTVILNLLRGLPVLYSEDELPHTLLSDQFKELKLLGKSEWSILSFWNEELLGRLHIGWAKSTGRWYMALCPEGMSLRWWLW